MSSKFKRVINTVLTALAGIVFITLGVAYYIEYSGMDIENPVETTGKIKHVREFRNNNTMLPTYDFSSFNPVVKFKTPDGTTHEFIELVAADEADEYRAGQIVNVIYNAEDPKDAKILRENSFWGVHLILIILGLVMFFLAYILFSSKEEKKI